MTRNTTEADDVDASGEPSDRVQAMAARLEGRPDVRRAVATWSDCDVAVLVPNGVDIVPIIDGYAVVDVNEYDAAPYNCVKLNEVSADE